ncbi:TRAP transporter large permease subunit [Paraburkholderia sp. RG36]|uniref:TRAP transporter large permease subunit n=2 Tax=Paraburkholderia tagetis TaxID=2913261 RepID=A0A9X1RFT3_9BURK|nr:TRAP transporter large permease subunit [Paraburkholderia tagetis]MCG5072076.1 TRAP transporter large permease subunit [Paraburkholderia tagetis]
MWVTEVPAAVLVVAEIALQLSNVIFRYVLKEPLIWGNELSALLFVWLAMLGAVIALRRGQHMRLGIFIARLSPPRRAFMDTLGNVVVVAFMLGLVAPAWEYMQDQIPILSPALEFPDAWRVSSIVVGVGLMLALTLTRLIARAKARDLIVSVAMVGAIAFVLFGSAAFFVELGNASLLVFFLFGVASMIAAGVPIFVAFGTATLAYLSCTTSAPLSIVVGRMDEGMSGLILLAVPLFVLLGALMESTGMAEAMIRFLMTLVGHRRGGLSYVLIGAMYLVSGISGSKVADMAAVAPALFPEMKKRGAEDGELVAMLGASGAMSETIPPSLVLITAGSVTGVSISALFTGGFMPAIVGAMAMGVVVWYRSRREDTSSVRKASAAQCGRALLFAAPALVLPFLIRAAVSEGVATATEVSTIGIAYTFVVGLALYRRFKWSRLYPILVETASLSGAILLIIGCATAMAWALTQSGFAHQLSAAMMRMPCGAGGFLAASALIFVVLGSFLEGIPAIVLFAPLLFPIARAFGINEVHYTMVVIFAMGLGLFAPPFGVGFFAACAIGKVNPDGAMKSMWIYLGALLVSLVMIAAVPWFSTGFL